MEVFRMAIFQLGPPQLKGLPFIQFNKLYNLRNKQSWSKSVVRKYLSDTGSGTGETAKKDLGCDFGTNGDIYIEKFKQSKYFQALFQQSNIGTAVNDVVLLASDLVCREFDRRGRTS
ncbi:uncharacterized protein LOC126611418 isoform X2 [Malus sylvestris]|uniref:uncharacterized protein LOC126611418 isoform X2 n=1 Tax=Malus sylvestris TaxID=3752 RepID=UPI0021AC2D3D|nr:uncharacterized protein LOC126611418 isoform X2 [Malus sylvestris]